MRTTSGPHTLAIPHGSAMPVLYPILDLKTDEEGCWWVMTDRQHTEGGAPRGIHAEPLIVRVSWHGKRSASAIFGGAAALLPLDEPVALRYQLVATVAVPDTHFLLSTCHSNILHFVDVDP